MLILKFGHLSFIIELEGSLYILDTESLVRHLVCKYLIPFIELPFTFSLWYLSKLRFSVLTKARVSVSLLLLLLLMSYLKMLGLTQGLKRLLLFSSEGLTVLTLEKGGCAQHACGVCRGGVCLCSAAPLSPERSWWPETFCLWFLTSRCPCPSPGQPPFCCLFEFDVLGTSCESSRAVLVLRWLV